MNACGGPIVVDQNFLQAFRERNLPRRGLDDGSQKPSPAPLVRTVEIALRDVMAKSGTKKLFGPRPDSLGGMALKGEFEHLAIKEQKNPTNPEGAGDFPVHGHESIDF